MDRQLINSKNGLWGRSTLRPTHLHERQASVSICVTCSMAGMIRDTDNNVLGGTR